MLHWLFQCTKWLFYLWLHFLHTKNNCIEHKHFVSLFVWSPTDIYSTSTSCQTTTFKVVSAILNNNITFSKKRSVIWPLPSTILKRNWCRSPTLPSDWLDHFAVNVCFSKPTWTVIGLRGPVFHFPLMRQPTNTPWGKICKLFVGFYLQ